MINVMIKSYDAMEEMCRSSIQSMGGMCAGYKLGVLEISKIPYS